MRLSKPKTDFLKKTITQYLPDTSVYLFGSRTNDDQKGGDIDILIIGERQLTGQEKRNIKITMIDFLRQLVYTDIYQYDEEK